MRVIYGSEKNSDLQDKRVITIGNFDGVHLGHQFLILSAKQIAFRNKIPLAIYTFDPHPVKILAPQGSPLLIQTLSQKLDCFEKLGVDICIVEKFSKEFASIEPEKFIKEILIEKLNASAIVVGYDFTYGIKRKGSTELLKSIGLKMGIEVKVIEAHFLDDLLLSSTEVRNFIRRGEIKRANLMLGRSYELLGIVIKGEGIGKKIGIPTANILPENSLVPENGVYITKASIDGIGNELLSVTSIGINPTFHRDKETIETHIIDYKLDELFNKKISLKFIEKIRDQCAFPNPESLVKEIEKDIQIAKNNRGEI